jgi:peptide deformylase
MVTILQKDAPILRQKAKPVPESMFGTSELAQIVADMKAAIGSQDDAVAIAAPQIGQPYRIFVVAARVFEMLDPENDENEGDEENDEDGDDGAAGKESGAAAAKTYEDQVFINPEIVKLSRTRKDMEEGCLSVRYLYGQVKRATKARVRARDEQGAPFEAGGSGLVAQIFQHECDHLDGVLFIDKASDLHDAPPEK